MEFLLYLLKVVGLSYLVTCSAISLFYVFGYLVLSVNLMIKNRTNEMFELNINDVKEYYRVVFSIAFNRIKRIVRFFMLRRKRKNLKHHH